MRLREIESLLRSEIEGAIAEGWILEPGRFGETWADGSATCCAIGALGRYESSLSLGADIAYAYGIDSQQVAAGFDGRDGHALIDGPLAQIGGQLRRDYLGVSK